MAALLHVSVRMELGLRVKVAIIFCSLVLVAVGTTGALLVIDSAGYQERQVVERELLLVQNRSLLMQTRIGVLLRELARLSRRAEIDPLDGDTAPERLLLGAAHGGSVLFPTAVVLVDRQGRVVHTEPEQGVLWQTQASLAQEAWWPRAFDAGSPFAFPLMVSRQPALCAVAPVRDVTGRFLGALVGIIELRALLALATRQGRSDERGEDTALADAGGRVLLWSSGAAPTPLGSVGAVIGGPAGTLRQGEMLWAHAPVGDHGFSALVRVPWAVLMAESAAQVRSVVIMLVAGVLVAVLVAIFLSGRVTRPVLALAGQADALAATLAGSGSRSNGRDELGILRRAFGALERALSERDARIARDLEQIRTIAADRERLNVELRDLADDLASRVEQRTAELRDAQRALLAAERLATIGKTAGALAHELRNALNGLSVATDLLAQAAAERSSAAVRQRAHREIARLRDLTESLLSFSGTPRLFRTREDLHELLQRAIANYEEDLREQGIPLVLSLHADGAALSVDCDAAKMVTVLGNLLRNAMEATMSARLAAGEDEPASARPIVVRTEVGADGAVRLEVLDHGVGLSEEARARLFEPFFTTKRTGTGLGLVTSQRFVQAHGGALSVGAGRHGETCFAVSLPARAPDDAAHELAGDHQGGARAAGEAARALMQRAS